MLENKWISLIAFSNLENYSRGCVLFNCLMLAEVCRVITSHSNII